jgi:hypothetical protein
LDVTEPVVSSMPGTTAVATARAAAEASTRIRNRMPHLGITVCPLNPGAQTAGPLTIAFDPGGHLTSLSLRGHVLADVCAALR